MRSPVKSILQRTLVVGLLWLATSLPAPAQGTIRYVPNVNLEYQLGDTPWDVDGDGTAEFNFRFTRGSVGLFPQANSHVLVLADPPPNIGGSLLPLRPPSEIGNFDYTPASWLGSLDPSGFPGAAAIAFCLDLGCGGPFFNQVAFFGFSFELDGQTHYGWGLFDGRLSQGWHLESYAYNIEPGASIFVGQVPEPSTWALMTVGAGLLGWRAWRKQKRV